MNNHFKVILTIRFFGYLLFFIGLIGFIFMLEPLLKAEVKYRLDRVLGVKRTVANAVTSQDVNDKNADSDSTKDGVVNFANLKAQENDIVPVSTEFGIVIEKINANAKIVPNVDAGDEKAYVVALRQGVAQALGSTPPGQPGNLYLFSHSTDAPWNIIRYNAIFFLLRELEKGDRVIIFYQDKRYDYIVYDKTQTSADDISYLTNRYNMPVLTLQTCDPPGTLLRRLVVRAKLVIS